MNDILQVLLWPALACLVVTGIHAYLGLHVVERGVIFVDLSLAQIASLGATIAFLIGVDVHGDGAYFFSLGFTLIGAALFTLTRTKKGAIPHEAIIGIVYAVSAAATVFVMDRAREGAEHIKYILVGNLLAVGPRDVLKIAILYSIIGLLHWWWREPFLLVSTNPAEAIRRGHNITLWDFLFYATFGIVVTASVAIAGVLLVFSYLIVPSVAAMLFSEKIGTRLTIGWALSTVVSFAGMYGSYALDAPTGATIVCTFGLALALLAGFKKLTAA
ncbi:MAG: iron chelate uptake ABC transporter family permease subunit [Elusimicrobiota bacterium]